MAGYRFFGLLLLMIAMLFLRSSSSSQAIAMKFDVDGKDEWVVKPSEDYNYWAQRNKFHVNDILYFKYKKENDSILVVKKDDYYSCNVNNPMHKMDDGDSTFHLNKLGYFFFISGNVDSCKKGQKLIVQVIAVKNRLHQAEPPSESPESALPPQQIHSSDLASSKVYVSARLQGSVGVGSNK
ncbi:early nodulin-like protein 4 [Gastrolobium bilobum]|uniref:early nodulin-like protein 4 n=1 Tax=Gastrolobium bilobum TaxID=150636 RepID=UPI002AB2C0DE|nr:early nodulin-like protein 4 [Gastrolobium bilobum]